LLVLLTGGFSCLGLGFRPRFDLGFKTSSSGSFSKFQNVGEIRKDYKQVELKITNLFVI